MDIKKPVHTPKPGGLEILKYIGPGLIVTVGFIDPGNWATNMQAGSAYGYRLLWVITLSTLMLIVLQHIAAHLGIVTGLCLAEACSKFYGRLPSALILGSAVIAAISTALAELLGAAIGLQMIFGLPVLAGAFLSAALISVMVFTNSYRKLERWIIGLVSLVGLAFLFELSLVHIEWGAAARGWVVPEMPKGSILTVMGVLGAVVMPHNLFLHSEIIQSRQWNLEGDAAIKRLLRYEFLDTLFAMLVGWGINSAMILVAASVFYSGSVSVTELAQAHAALKPLLGRLAATVFGAALLLSGISSSVTASIAGGSIFAGFYREPLDLADSHSRTGVIITLAGALLVIIFLTSPFSGIIWSQTILSIQLPLTIFPLIFLTSSKKVMGKFSNYRFERSLLWITGIVVVLLNMLLLIETIRPDTIYSFVPF